MQMSGAAKLKEPGVYEEILANHAHRSSLSTQQIELVRLTLSLSLSHISTHTHTRSLQVRPYACLCLCLRYICASACALICAIDSDRAHVGPGRASYPTHQSLLSDARRCRHPQAPPRPHRLQLVRSHTEIERESVCVCVREREMEEENDIVHVLASA
jgi:hypothetical protein